jgi:hypothetical protein
MAHPNIDTHLNPQTAQKDSAQVRLEHFQCLQFIGASAPQRIAKFVREYVNTATLKQGGVASNPADYTIDDQGLPAALLHTIYFSDGMWYIFFDHHASYDAATFPFNQLPSPSDTGYDL